MYCKRILITYIISQNICIWEHVSSKITLDRNTSSWKHSRRLHSFWWIPVEKESYFAENIKRSNLVRIFCANIILFWGTPLNIKIMTYFGFNFKDQQNDC